MTQTARRWGTAMATAARDGTPWPLLADGADLAAGYAAQDAHVRARLEHDSIDGFKAALTAPEAQRMFGADAPLGGVLFASRGHTGHVHLRAHRYPGGILETEIAFRARRPIERVPHDRDELRASMRCALPAIEIGSTAVQGGGRPALADLVAANAFNAGHIAGPESAVGRFDLAALTVRLYRDGVLLHEGTGAEVMGDPWAALAWLVEHALSRGYPIGTNTLFLTGSIGRIQPMQPGAHRATWSAPGGVEGDFGAIDFVVD